MIIFPFVVSWKRKQSYWIQIWNKNLLVFIKQQCYFTLPVRNLFHNVGPLKLIAKRGSFDFKLYIFKLLSEHLVGYKWLIIENTWLNVLGIGLRLTLNINKRYFTILIWYTFKMFNCLIKSLDEIDRSFADIQEF